MKKKIPLNVRLPRRLYKVIMDIRPLFIDSDEKDPIRGATTKALEHILQFYMESEDYLKKLKVRKEVARTLFYYMVEKDKEKIMEFMKLLEEED